MKDVPYVVFESELARLERIIHRQFALIVIAVLLLVGTNACWIYYESKFQEITTTEVTQDLDSGDGGDAIINDGVRINGEGETDSQCN